MIYEIIGGVVLIFGMIALVFRLEAQGRKSEQNDQMKQVLDDIEKAKRARDSLECDAAAAKRLRDRFTRQFLRDL